MGGFSVYRSDSLENQLVKKPFEFEFSQVVRILEKSFIPFGSQEAGGIFFKSCFALSGAPSDVFKVLKGVSPQKPLSGYFSFFNHTANDYTVYVNFFGILGAQGPLPFAYTEKALISLKEKDCVLPDFLDLFNNRFLHVWWANQKKYTPILGWEPPEKSKIGKTLLSLTGFKLSKENVFSERSFLPMARAIWKRPHTPQGLSLILSQYFKVPSSISLFHGSWYALSFEKWARLLRSKPPVLGKNLILGRRAWYQADAIIVTLKIQDPEVLLDFLPGGKRYVLCCYMIRLYMGLRLRFKLGLSFSGFSVFRLGYSKRPLRLGWTTWLGRRENIKMQSTALIHRPLRG